MTMLTAMVHLLKRWPKLGRMVAEKAAWEAAKPRCPRCGTWISTRYGGHNVAACMALGDPRSSDPRPIVPPMPEPGEGVAALHIKASPQLKAVVDECVRVTHTATDKLQPGYEPPRHTAMCRLRYRHCLKCTCGWDRPPATDGGALNRAGRYPRPINWPNAPASPVAAAIVGWVCGAVCGAFVAVLTMSLLP